MTPLYCFAGGITVPENWRTKGWMPGRDAQVVYGPLLFYTDNCCKEFNVICGIWDHLAVHMSVARAKQGGTAADFVATAENVASADGGSCSDNDEHQAVAGQPDPPSTSGKNILEKTAVYLVDS